jgi:uncharacterized protein
MPVHNALIIFIKNPQLGKVKTRIAQELGDDVALMIYNDLLKITQNTASQANCRRILFYSDFIDESDDWDNTLYDKQLQKGEDLGERMKNAFDYAFQDPKTQHAVIIGSDCPHLATWHIEKAFIGLDTHDFSLGPAQDGGYYLLGMKELQEEIFDNKQWSTHSVLADTHNQMRTLRKSCYLLPSLADVDTIENIPLLGKEYVKS